MSLQHQPTISPAGACQKRCPIGNTYAPWNLYSTFDIITQGWGTGDANIDGAYTICQCDYTGPTVLGGMTNLTTIFNYGDGVLLAGEPECSIVAFAVCCRPANMNRVGAGEANRGPKAPFIPMPTSPPHSRHNTKNLKDNMKDTNLVP
jgi:hypothetical protein